MSNPLVLTRNDWYPPEGVSALPVDVQKMVPAEMQYWNEPDGGKREEMLDVLRDAWDGNGFIEKDAKEAKIHIAKSNYEKQWVFGMVLAPHEIDSWGDYETPEEIEDAIASYMSNIWKGQKPESVGSEHEKPIEAIPIQCFQAPVDFWYDGVPNTAEYMVPKGAWVLGVHILDKKEFEKAVSGEYSGFSMQGTGLRRKAG